jgi:hypothetical protein
VNKKKQKNFMTWDSACGEDSATRKRQRRKSFTPGQRHMRRPGVTKVFCFFFSKKKRLLTSLNTGAA